MLKDSYYLQKMIDYFIIMVKVNYMINFKVIYFKELDSLVFMKFQVNFDFLIIQYFIFKFNYLNISNLLIMVKLLHYQQFF